MNRALQIMLSFISPHVITTPQITFDGAMLDPTSAANVIAALAQNGASSAGGVAFTTQSGTTATLTAIGNASFQFTAGSATTLTIDSAYNICRLLPQPLFVGQQATFEITTNASTTIATPTLSDTAVTLAGTTSMLASALRKYYLAITQVNTTTGSSFTAGTTFTSLTQVGSTNNYTVALGTNTISPTVGNLIYLNVTTGTLPSGWYPINKVSSATSFVIAAPTAGTAWTATAATLGSGNAPSPVYSPLVTITGMYTVGANVAV